MRSPQNRKQSARRQRGVASLELVMSFPILVILVAMLFTLGMKTKKKSQLTMDVRRHAWTARTNPNDPRPFSVVTAHSAGQSENIKQDSITMYADMMPFIPRDIKWGNVVMTGSWDHRQVEFADGNWIPIYPHFGVLMRMVTAQGGVDSSTGSVDALSGLVDIPH